MDSHPLNKYLLSTYVCQALETGRGRGTVQALTGPYGMSHDVGEDTGDAKVGQLGDRVLWEKQLCVPQRAWHGAYRCRKPRTSWGTRSFSGSHHPAAGSLSPTEATRALDKGKGQERIKMEPEGSRSLSLVQPYLMVVEPKRGLPVTHVQSGGLHSQIWLHFIFISPSSSVGSIVSTPQT